MNVGDRVRFNTKVIDSFYNTYTQFYEADGRLHLSREEYKCFVVDKTYEVEAIYKCEEGRHGCFEGKGGCSRTRFAIKFGKQELDFCSSFFCKRFIWKKL